MSGDEYIKDVRKFLQETQNESFPYGIECLGKKFVVRENTYSPKYMLTTEALAKNLPFDKGAEILEIGTGIGVISIIAALNGASRVVATNISHDAVENAKKNILNHQVEDRVEVRWGDMFDPILPDEKFDLIFTDLPYCYVVGELKISIFERSLFDPGYCSYKKYVMEGPQYLKPSGRIMFGFSTDVGQVNRLEEIVNEAGYKIDKNYQEVIQSDLEDSSWLEEIYELCSKE